MKTATETMQANDAVRHANEQACRAAYDDFYHKVRALVDYDHWCGIWNFIGKRFPVAPTISIDASQVSPELMAELRKAVSVPGAFLETTKGRGMTQKESDILLALITAKNALAEAHPRVSPHLTEQDQAAIRRYYEARRNVKIALNRMGCPSPAQADAAPAAQAQPGDNEIMEKVQEFASTWAIAGGPFDDGTAMERAEECKEEIRALLSRAGTSQPAAPVSAEPVAHPMEEIMGYRLEFKPGEYCYYTPEGYALEAYKGDAPIHALYANPQPGCPSEIEVYKGWCWVRPKYNAGVVDETFWPLFLGPQLGAPVASQSQQPVSGAKVAPNTIEQLAIYRYRPVPSGLIGYKVVAGDGSRSLFSGTKNECYIVARKLTEAFLDGAYVALQDHAFQPQSSGNSGELTDGVRVPLDRLHADAEYLLSRVNQGTLSVHDAAQSIRSHIDSARAALAQQDADRKE